MTHSPSPWTCDDNGDRSFITDADDCIVAEVMTARLHGADLREHNSRLLAAAPLMLDALKNISDCGLVDCNCGKPCSGTCTYAMVENALKAVKGIK